MELDPEEVKQLHEVREVCNTSYTVGWTGYLLPKIKEFVEEAHEDMLGAVHASDAVMGGFTKRWVQREAMLRGILEYVARCEDDRKRILQEIEERKKQYDSVPVEG
jgi:hypothetical protein